MSGAMPGEIAGAAGGAGGGGSKGGKGGGQAGAGSPMDWSNTGTGLLNNIDPATMGAGTTAGLTGDPTGSLGAAAAAVAGGPPTPDQAFAGPPQGTGPTPSPPTPNVQPSLPPIGAPVPDSAFAGPPPFTPGGTTTSRGPIATPGGGPPAGQGFGGGNVTQATPEPTPVSIGSTGLSPTLAQIAGGYGGGSPTQEATNVVPFPRMNSVDQMLASQELGYDPAQPFAAPTAGAAPTGDVGGGIQGVPPEDSGPQAIGPPTAGAAPTGDVGGGIQGVPPADVTAIEPPAGQGFGGGSPTQTAEGPGPTQPIDAASTQPTFARQPGQLGPRGVGYAGGPQPGAEPAPATADIPPAPSPPKLGTETPTGPAQAAPGTTAGGQPGAGAAGQAGQFNPLKIFGDILQLALTGNPYPLMSDLGGLASQAAGMPPTGAPGAPPPGQGYGGGPAPAPTGAGAAAPGVRAGAPQGAASQLPGAPNGPDPKADDELGQRRKQWYAQNPNKGTFPEDVPEYQGPGLPKEQQAANAAVQGGGTPEANANYLTQNGGSSTINGVKQSGLGNLNQDFAQRLAAAGRAYEQETGQKPQYGEGYRDDATQLKYWNKLQGGRLGPVARPQALGGRGSLHEFGRAMDMPDAGFTKWLQQGNAQRFGLGFPVPNDSNHIQMEDLRGNQYPYTPAQGSPGAQSGTTQTTGQTRGDINNNPGNIKKGPWTTRAIGYDAQGHAIYNNAQDGIADQADLLRGKYNNMTVPQMSRIYTTTAQASWARTVMQVGGFGPNEVLNLNDPATLNRLQRAIWRAEGTRPPVGQQSSAADFLSDQGFSMVG